MMPPRPYIHMRGPDHVAAVDGGKQHISDDRGAMP